MLSTVMGLGDVSSAQSGLDRKRCRLRWATLDPIANRRVVLPMLSREPQEALRKRRVERIRAAKILNELVVDQRMHRRDDLQCKNCIKRLRRHGRNLALSARAQLY